MKQFMPLYRYTVKENFGGKWRRFSVWDTKENKEYRGNLQKEDALIIEHALNDRKFKKIIPVKRKSEHRINPIREPVKSKLTPAQWHKEIRKHPYKTKIEKKTFYECPVCKTPMNKTGWCETDRIWSVLSVAQ